MISNGLVLWSQAVQGVIPSTDNPIVWKQRLVDGLNDNEKEAMCEALLFVHLARNVYYGGGVLESDCINRINAVHLLYQIGLIDKHEKNIRDTGRKIIFIDNQLGYDIAAKFLQIMIDSTEVKALGKQCHPIAIWVLDNLFFLSAQDRSATIPEHFNDISSIGSYHYFPDTFFHWLVKVNKPIYNHVVALLGMLEGLGLIHRATEYNAVRTIGRVYVLPEETNLILDSIKEAMPDKLLGRMEEYKMTMPLRYNALKFLSSYDARTYEDIGDYRRSQEQTIAYLSTVFRDSVVFDEHIGLSGQPPFIVRNIVLYKSLLEEAKNAIIRELLTGLDWPFTETSLTISRE